MTTADKHLTQMAALGYPAPYREPDGTYVWGSNGLVASGADWPSWTLRFTWPGNQKITQGWSATWTQTGAAVTATPMSYNSPVPAGGSVQTGFNASSTPPHPEPTDFTVNGQPCSKA